MEPSDALPFVARIDDCTDPSDVIDMLALAEFYAGAQPWARLKRLHRVRADAPLLPSGTTPARCVRATRWQCHLAHGEGWTLRVMRWRDGTADLNVTAVTEELADQMLEAAAKDALEPEPPRAQAIEVGFWHMGTHGPKRTARSVDVDPWDEIRRNYAAAPATAIDELATKDPDSISGRLMLLHGPPGTGKTTALRALGDAWRDWCGVDYILDPDRLLADTSYLVTVLLGDTDDVSQGRWRLLVLEDCDELLRADAKSGTGQALARLLNLTDGLIGQGLEVLVCITTNEPLHRLHPAIIRPGRCLAEIYVGPLTRDEAAEWLGDRQRIKGDGATLAELFALQGDISKVERPEPLRVVGQYL